MKRRKGRTRLLPGWDKARILLTRLEVVSAEGGFQRLESGKKPNESADRLRLFS